MRIPLNNLSWLVAVLTIGSLLMGPYSTVAQSPDIPAAPVPRSPYLNVVYRYADTLLAHARDTAGPIQTGLFVSALDRQQLHLLTNRPAPPVGVREGDRCGSAGKSLTGANPHHDQNLLRLLQVLTGLSGDRKYQQAADEALSWFLQNAASIETSLLPWGEHLSWDIVTDQPTASQGEAVHEFFRPWMLWDRCFDLAPEASARVARGLWDHQIADHRTGAFDRHALFARHGAADGYDFPRHAGFYLRTWATAYDRTHENVFEQAADVLLRRFEEKRDSNTGLIPSSSGKATAWPPSNLSLAIDCYGSSLRFQGSLANRLRAFATREDEVFVSLPHDLQTRRGFLTVLDWESPNGSHEFSPLWQTRYGQPTTAQVGMMCVARFDNGGAVAYRELILAAADAYLEQTPTADVEVWPGTLGQAISLQLAAWRHTAHARYLQHARTLADWSLEHFWGDNQLPRASSHTDHYESITGSDTLALALTELHLQILAITAVRCPPNTIDR